MLLLVILDTCKEERVQFFEDLFYFRTQDMGRTMLVGHHSKIHPVLVDPDFWQVPVS